MEVEAAQSPSSTKRGPGRPKRMLGRRKIQEDSLLQHAVECTSTPNKKARPHSLKRGNDTSIDSRDDLCHSGPNLFSPLIDETEELTNVRIEDAIVKKYGGNVDDVNLDNGCNKHYLVECLRDRRERILKGSRVVVEFLIKWKGYPESENTWESEAHLGEETFSEYELWWAENERESESDSDDDILPSNVQMSKFVRQSALDSVKKEAKEILLRTALDDHGLHHAPLVCICCDRTISSCETPLFISKNRLMKHSHRISVESYESFYRVCLPIELISQYSVEGLEGLLLSKRSRGDHHKHLICSSCNESFRMKHLHSAPPKFSIANGFAIGTVPEQVISHNDISDIMASLIAPVRPFSFIFSYYGGQQKAIRGHYCFFNNDIQHAGSVVHNYQGIGANANVYVVLCGRFTPRQRIIAKNKARLDVRQFLNILRWFIEESGHPAFANMMLPENCPEPVVIEDVANQNNTDEEIDSEKESQFTGGRFFFPSAHQPNDVSGTCSSQQSFIKAMLDGTAPTLLFHGGEFANERDVPITSMFPVQFPFGQGGADVDRRNQVATKECLKHYFRLSLPQMQRPDFILVVASMYNRILSFETGFIQCQSNYHTESLALRVCELTSGEIAQAAKRKDDGLPVSGTAGKFFNAISTACQPVGHTNEAAALGRRKMFALMDYFGESSIFLSVTPDDQNSFQVKLFATCKEVSG